MKLENVDARYLVASMLAVVIVTFAIFLPTKPAKAGRQYRVSVYSGGHDVVPVRTWVVDDYNINGAAGVISFEMMGKRTIVRNNWVVEEQ